jgi:hypothetical protein
MGEEVNNRSRPGTDSTAGVLGQLQYHTRGGIITDVTIQ